MDGFLTRVASPITSKLGEYHAGSGDVVGAHITTSSANSDYPGDARHLAFWTKTRADIKVALKSGTRIVCGQKITLKHRVYGMAALTWLCFVFQRVAVLPAAIGQDEIGAPSQHTYLTDLWWLL